MAGDRRLLGREELLAALEDLARELRRRETSAKLFVVGGAALAIAYDRSRVTKDVDVLVAPSADLAEAAAAVARRRGLAADWIDDGARVFAPRTPRNSHVIASFDGLEVSTASPRYLLAMKLFAARHEDVGDIALLAGLAGVTGSDEAISLVETAYADWFERAESGKRLAHRQAFQRRKAIEAIARAVLPASGTDGDREA